MGNAQDMPIGKDSAHFFGINYAMPIDSKVGYSPILVMPQDFSGQNLQGRSFRYFVIFIRFIRIHFGIAGTLAIP